MTKHNDPQHKIRPQFSTSTLGFIVYSRDAVRQDKRVRIPAAHQPAGAAKAGRRWVTCLILMLALAGFGPARSAADPTTAAQAATVVGNWLAQNPAPLNARLSRAISRIDTYPDAGGGAAYYIVSLNPAGFVIVAGDDLVEPIVGFSPTGHFDPATANPLGALVGRDLPGRIAHIRQGRAAAPGKGQAFAPDAGEQHAQRKWGTLGQAAAAQTSAKAGAISDIRVSPLLKSEWDQATDAANHACYNYYTPPGSAGAASNYPAGCVATATAQLMRYYQYPTTRVGTPSFTITVNGKKASRTLRGGDGAGGAYAWGSMPLTPDFTNMTAAQYQMIGALTADVGSAVSMDYAKSGSGASLQDAGSRLVDTFHFSSAIDGYAGGVTIDALNLYKMINPNLDAGYPVLLGIENPSEGHAVVCDGYGYDTTTIYHHLNMGWSGYDDAWYNLPTIDATDVTFNAVTEILFNIYVSGSGEMVSGRVTDSGGAPVAGVKLTAYMDGGGATTATSDSHGIYALRKLPSLSRFTVMAQKGSMIFKGQSVYTGLSMSNIADNGNYWGLNFKAAPGKNGAQGWEGYE